MRVNARRSDRRSANSKGSSFKIADMKTRIEASRLLIYDAAIAKENSKKTGERYTLKSSHGQTVCIGDRHVLRPRGRADPRRRWL